MDSEKENLLFWLMYKIGFTIWQLQELENTLATYFVIRLKACRGIGKEKGEALLQTARKKTLGGLIRDLEKGGVVPATMATRLCSILEKRNWLVHNARRENRGILSSPSKYDLFIGQLESIASEAMALLKEIGQEVENYVLCSGVDKSKIDSEADRLLKEWGLTEYQQRRQCDAN